MLTIAGVSNQRIGGRFHRRFDCAFFRVPALDPVIIYTVLLDYQFVDDMTDARKAEICQTIAHYAKEIYRHDGGVIIPYRVNTQDESIRLEQFIRTELLEQEGEHKFHWDVNSYPLSAGGFGLRVTISPHHICKPDCRTDDHNPKTGKPWGDVLDLTQGE
jgi:hypothetical protein